MLIRFIERLNAGQMVPTDSMQRIRRRGRFWAQSNRVMQSDRWWSDENEDELARTTWNDCKGLESGYVSELGSWFQGQPQQILLYYYFWLFLTN